MMVHEHWVLLLEWRQGVIQRGRGAQGSFPPQKKKKKKKPPQLAVSSEYPNDVIITEYPEDHDVIMG